MFCWLVLIVRTKFVMNKNVVSNETNSLINQELDGLVAQRSNGRLMDMRPVPISHQILGYNGIVQPSCHVNLCVFFSSFMQSFSGVATNLNAAI